MHTNEVMCLLLLSAQFVGCAFWDHDSKKSKDVRTCLYSTWSIVSRKVDMKTKLATSDDGT